MTMVELTHEESYLRKIQDTIKMHRLIRDGEVDSLVDDIIRNGYDQHWHNMTKEQKNSIWDLSERLLQLGECNE